MDRIWQQQRSGRLNETVGFARFENTAGTIEICEEVLPPAHTRPGEMALGFDNPMFSQVRFFKRNSFQKYHAVGQ